MAMPNVGTQLRSTTRRSLQAEFEESNMNLGADNTLEAVRAVYSGAEGELWELLMGQQIHIGGLKASADLAERAQIGAGQQGVDLCCCNGAGMRFLVRFCGVAAMTGVDATGAVIERGKERCRAEGVSEQIRFVHADACATGLADDSADFVWGEDAWCYVFDKARLISEAVRVVKSSGTIAFTDWVSGTVPMTAEESDRFLRFMSFPNVQDVEGYCGLLEGAGCTVMTAEDTGRFAPYVDLYLEMVDKQLTYDALRILDFNAAALGAIGAEMQFLRDLAHAGKIAQGRFIAQKG
jgi:SAM-dependent methyltransferase